MEALPVLVILLLVGAIGLIWLLRRVARSRLTVPSPPSTLDPEEPSEAPIDQDERPVPPGADYTVPGEVVGEVRQLLTEGLRLEAMKLVEDHTGFGPRESKAIVDAIRGAEESRHLDDAVSDLAQRARRMKAQGHFGEAIEVVKEETGMTLTESAAFVEALDI